MAVTMADLINQHRATEAAYKEAAREYERSSRILHQSLGRTGTLAHDGDYWSADSDGLSVICRKMPMPMDQTPVRRAVGVEAPLSVLRAWGGG
jgi:hypothetical protein